MVSCLRWAYSGEALLSILITIGRQLMDPTGVLAILLGLILLLNVAIERVDRTADGRKSRLGLQR
jgi:hypothetical protein